MADVLSFYKVVHGVAKCTNTPKIDAVMYMYECFITVKRHGRNCFPLFGQARAVDPVLSDGIAQDFSASKAALSNVEK
jgi:hypothetical protein